MLDINTKKGYQSLIHEQHMLEYIEHKFKNQNISIVQTLKDKSAINDGFLIQNKQVIGLFESKCRNLSYTELKKYGSWIITFEKLEKCRELSFNLQIPFFGFLYLLKDQKVLQWKIAEDGNYCFEFKTINTQTQETINGGLIIRKNSYLPIKHSKFI